MLGRIAVKLHILVVQSLVEVVSLCWCYKVARTSLDIVDVMHLLCIVFMAVCHNGVKTVQIGFYVKLHILCH